MTTTTEVGRTGRMTDKKCGVVREHYETLYFIPEIGTHPPGTVQPNTVWVRLKRLRTGVGRFRSCLLWLLPRPVRVAQRNRLLTITVQSIDLPTEA